MTNNKCARPRLLEILKTVRVGLAGKALATLLLADVVLPNTEALARFAVASGHAGLTIIEPANTAS